MTADEQDLEEEDDSLMQFDKQSVGTQSQGSQSTRPTSQMSMRNNTPSK